MKFIFLFCLLCGTQAFAQVNEKSQVHEWLQQHPEMKLVSVTEYNQFSHNDKLALASMEDHIVYSDGLKLSDIEAYETAVDKLEPRTDVEYVFKWCLQHPSVKIITHSYFISLNSERQLMYRNSGALILMGDEITRADIFLYEN